MTIGTLQRLRTRFRGGRQAEPISLFAVPDLRAHRQPDADRRIGVLVYTGVTTSEVDEPVRRLADGLGADIVHIAIAGQPVIGVEPVRTVFVDHTVDDAPAIDVLVVPGGLGWQRIANHEAAMQWLASAAHNASGILTMSTGSLLLASAGRLTNTSATGHWLARESLASLGVEVTTDRTATSADNRVVTTSGATAALTVCSALAQRLRWGP